MNNSDMWSSVLARDAAADGRFVYAVRSTGIYCRPSCPSRKPVRENVRFFPHPSEAERAGFRACRRCGEEVGSSPAAASIVSAACAAIDSIPEQKPTVASLAAAAGVSTRRLQQLFREVLACHPGSMRRRGGRAD